MKKFLLIAPIYLLSISIGISQEHSIAREWNEIVIEAMRNDRARPTVSARNLWHMSVLMYDCWAAYDTEGSDTYFLGKENFGWECPFEGVPAPANVDSARHEAICYGMYRFLRQRYRTSPGFFVLLFELEETMDSLGYSTSYLDTDYTNGNPAALGNYIADQLLEYGFQDGANELLNYPNLYYEPINEGLDPLEPGNPDITDVNRWQRLILGVFIGQTEIPDAPDFLSPEWGQVNPFSLTMDDANVYERDDFEYIVYHDPGPAPLLDSLLESDEYKWGFSMVAAWASHLDENDGVTLDISPGARGNLSDLPSDFSEYPNYYDYEEGGMFQSKGHDLNPFTGQPYEENIVKRGDYTRILAEFWADGPDSETPPGHWFTILNYVIDHPEFNRAYRGFSEIDDQLEYDVKAYFMLGGAMHDSAISAWGIKGYYDYLRPISAIRLMVDNGQSSDPTLPNYSNLGIKLVPGKIEMVTVGDSLAGNNNEHVGKIKVYSWRGPEYITDPETQTAGVGWILGENWWPYQRPTFVTPPFAGYVSGHSTFSRAAAEILTYLTGDEYFPGGMGEFLAPANEFLVFEDGPTEDVTLQWATYRDASDETSLSRIWGGIHPPADDIPGREIGIKIAASTIKLAEEYFFEDKDGDGYYSYNDCDDNNPMMNPGFAEICDDLDNDCNGIVNDGVPLNTYYFDGDFDGFGELEMTIDTCISVPPSGYVVNSTDCNDLDENIFPTQEETCDAIDNDCDGELNNGLARYIYYRDFDEDGFGDLASELDTCISNPPLGFVVNSDDCNDDVASIYPGAEDIPDNDIDEDCSGFDLYNETKYLSNTINSHSNGFVGSTSIEIRYNHNGPMSCELYARDGRLIHKNTTSIENNFFIYEIPAGLIGGIYILRYFNEENEIAEVAKVFVH